MEGLKIGDNWDKVHEEANRQNLDPENRWKSSAQLAMYMYKTVADAIDASIPLKEHDEFQEQVDLLRAPVSALEEILKLELSFNPICEEKDPDRKNTDGPTHRLKRQMGLVEQSFESTLLSDKNQFRQGMLELLIDNESMAKLPSCKALAKTPNEIANYFLRVTQNLKDFSVEFGQLLYDTLQNTLIMDSNMNDEVREKFKVYYDAVKGFGDLDFVKISDMIIKSKSSSERRRCLVRLSNIDAASIKISAMANAISRTKRDSYRDINFFDIENPKLPDELRQVYVQGNFAQVSRRNYGNHFTLGRVAGTVACVALVGSLIWSIAGGYMGKAINSVYNFGQDLYVGMTLSEDDQVAQGMRPDFQTIARVPEQVIPEQAVPEPVQPQDARGHEQPPEIDRQELADRPEPQRDRFDPSAEYQRLVDVRDTYIQTHNNPAQSLEQATRRLTRLRGEYSNLIAQRDALPVTAGTEPIMYQMDGFNPLNTVIQSYLESQGIEATQEMILSRFDRFREDNSALFERYEGVSNEKLLGVKVFNIGFNVATYAQGPNQQSPEYMANSERLDALRETLIPQAVNLLTVSVRDQKIYDAGLREVTDPLEALLTQYPELAQTPILVQ